MIAPPGADGATTLIGYLVMAVLVTLTPGPNLAVVIRTALESGAEGGLRATLGIGLGLALWAALATIGIAAILAAAPIAYAVLRATGGVWLIVLGVRAWRAAVRSRDGPPEPARRHRDFQAGFLTVVLNPLAGAFYVAALPSFVRPGDGAVGTTLLLPAIHIGLVLVWMALCSLFVGRSGRAFGPASLRIVTRATAVVLVVFGIRAVASVAI